MKKVFKAKKLVYKITSDGKLYRWLFFKNKWKEVWIQKGSDKWEDDLSASDSREPLDSKR